MKLTFPPKKFQIRFTVLGILFAILVMFSPLIAPDLAGVILPIFLGFIENFFLIIVSLFPANEDSKHLLPLLLTIIVSYAFLFWFFGSIMWMIINSIKKKKNTD